MLVLFYILAVVMHVKSGFLLEEGEFFYLAEELILREGRKIPLFMFADETQFFQNIDRVNEISTYKLMTGNQVNENFEYMRRSIDKDKFHFVLKAEEDQLKEFKDKKVYIYMRNNVYINSSVYFASVVYISSYGDGSCPHNYMGVPWCVEWDCWSLSRHNNVKTTSNLFGWRNCADSFLSSCPFNYSGQGNSNPTGFAPRTPPTADFRKLHNESLRNNETDPGLAQEIFWDIDPGELESRYVGYILRKSVNFSVPKWLKGKVGKVEGKAFFRRKNSQSSVSDIHNAYTKKKKMVSTLFSTLVNIFRGHEEAKKWKTKLRKLALSFGLGKYYKIKKDPDLFKTFLAIGDVQELERKIEYLETFGVTKPLEQVEVEKDIDVSNVTALVGEEVEHEETPISFEKAGSGRSFSNSNHPADFKTSNQDALPTSFVYSDIFLTKTDIFTHTGWKMNSTKDSRYFFDEEVVFYGLGNCAFDPEKSFNSKKFNVRSLNELFKDCAKVLRTQCHPDTLKYMKYLLKKQLLVHKFGFGLTFNTTNEILQKSKLTHLEHVTLFSSFELAELIGTEPLTPALSSEQISSSRSVRFLIRFALHYLEEGKRTLHHHFIKAGRHLVVTLKGVFSRLIQDYEMLRNLCSNPQIFPVFSEVCAKAIEENKSDLYYVMAMIKFIVHNGDNRTFAFSTEKFLKFCKKFHKFIETSVSNFQG